MVFKIIVVGSNPASLVFIKMFIFLKSRILNLGSISKIFWFLFCFVYDFWNLCFSNLDLKRKQIKDKENLIYYNYSVFKLKEFYNTQIFEKNFILIDLIWTKLMSYKFTNKNYKTDLFRAYFRVLNTNQGFYLNFEHLKNKKNFLNFLSLIFFSGFKYIWLGIRFWVVALLGGVSIIYCTLVLKSLPFNKIMLAWVSIIMFLYWLISGFVFFFKKYQFGKYTTVVQRFWRRSYMLFWMIEGSTFLVFLFLTINSSQESFYMFDQISILKSHLYSWRFFFLKIFPLILLIVSTYLLMVSLKWNVYSKHSIWLLILTFFLTYTIWLEFYQFYHVLNFYGNLNWVYDVDDHSWSLEQEPRRTRIVNHYVMLLFILKFWHIVLIYGFWIFFVLRCWETKRIRYPLLAANFQNFIILYIFAWVFMYPWFKFFFRKFLDTPYYWFYINNRRLAFRVFFNDLKLIYYSFFNFFEFYEFNFLNQFNYTSFYYWKLNNYENSFESFRKHIIRDRVIKSLQN
jgi:hypothetical protein